MARREDTSSFKPNLASHPDSFDYKYVYFKNLVNLDSSEDWKELYTTAKSQFDVSLTQIEKMDFTALETSLDNLIKQEETSEQKYIEKYKKNQDFKGMSNADFLKIINDILGNKEIFDRNISIIKNYNPKEKDKSPKYVDVIKFFPEKLSDAISSELKTKGTDTLKDDELKKLIQKTLKALYKGVKNEDPYKKFYEAVQRINSPNTAVLLKKILDILKGDMEKNPQEKGKEYLNFQINSAQKTGFIFEEIEQKVFKLFGKLAVNTDSTYMKADNIIIETTNTSHKINENESDILTEESVYNLIMKDYLPNEDSVRLKNIERVKELFTKLQNASGDIVFISDKQYDIFGKSFEGFKAEEPTFTKLVLFLEKIQDKNLQNAFKQVPNFFNILLFLLTNVSSQMIGYDNKERLQAKITDLLVKNIAYFLFDDIVITASKDSNPIAGNSNLNLVHIFNLNGIYVPLSILLKGIKNGMKGIKYSKVNISSYNFKEEDTKDEEEKTIADWKTYGQIARDKGKISIHFFKDFINFIKNTFQDVKI